MKKREKLLSFLLAALLLLGTVPAFAASPTGGLNGSTCQGADFNKSVYTSVTDEFDIRNGRYVWPSSGTVLVTASSSNWAITKFNGITIPKGLVVDFYKYYKFSGDPDRTYVLLGHFDTTNGKPYTIGSNAVNGYTAVPDADGWVPSYKGEPKWRAVKRVFTPGTPSASYKSSYTDVSPDAWYYDAVMTLADGGLLDGYENGRFSEYGAGAFSGRDDGMFRPDSTFTRAQLEYVTIRTDNTESFRVSPNKPTIKNYYPYSDDTVADRAFTAICLVASIPEWDKVLLTNYEKSLIADATSLYADNRYNNTMHEAVYDVWRCSLSKDIEYRSSIDQFPDADKIHQWIEENIELASERLILTNYTHDELVRLIEKYFLRAWNLGMLGAADAEGNFDPYGTPTRAQLCQAMYDLGWTYTECLNYYCYYRK